VLDAPPEATPDVLDRSVLRELRSLPKDLADRVAVHLAAAGLLVDDEPELAHRHAAEARRLAGRIAAVREAAGLTAYAAGEYGAALTDLRAARRLADNPDVLPVMADCERGLGRPERALELAQHPDVRRLDRAGRVELLIVIAGARRDMGQVDAAVLTLETPELRSGDVAEWTPRLWYAYADALLAAGRKAEAADWFRATAAIDDDEVTDAADRAAALEVAGGGA
jgi:tetratricopeptide (TPR) repeat protein